MIKTKRIYEQLEEDGSLRILIDRLWPRGVSKEKACIDHWFKELAPSHELRKWYQHDHAKWEEFQLRYYNEIDRSQPYLMELVELAKDRDITLVFSSKETKKNNATALKKYLEALTEAGRKT